MNSQRILRSLLIATSSTFIFASGSAAAAQCTLQAGVNIYNGAPFFDEPPEPGDHTGETVTSGDFDGDGLGDTVFAAPREDIGDKVDAGIVYVAYGKVVNQKFTQAQIPFQAAITGSMFGHSLGAGDFNGDGYDDLVVSAYHAANGPGRYFVIPGSASGLKLQQTTHVPTDAPTSVTAMDAADFDNDGRDDLVLGEWWYPGSCPSGTRQGRLVIAFGSSTASLSFDRIQATDGSVRGIQCSGAFGRSLAHATVKGSRRILAGQPGYTVPGTIAAGSYMQFEISKGGWLTQMSFDHAVQPFARFGHSFAVGDFDDDGGEDVAISAPGNFTTSGWIRIAYQNGKTQLLGRNQFGGPNANWFGEFGAKIVAGNFDGPGPDDLLIGEPLYNYDTSQGGALLIARGSPTGLQPVHAEYTVVAGFDTSDYGRRLAVTDEHGDGTDEFIIGNPISKLSSIDPAGSGFVVRGNFLNLDDCAPL